MCQRGCLTEAPGPSIVATMETGNRRDPDEARNALDLTGEADAAVRKVPLPGWFFAAGAALVALLLLAQMMDPEKRRTTMFGVLVVALLLNMRMQQRHGVLLPRHRGRELTIFLVVILTVIAGTTVAAYATGSDWIWIVGAGLAAAVVLVTGFFYSRDTSH